ncbi:MAG TPA: hypothetical protein DCP40_06055, partial [Stenotrophomonas sp.]|nr:hypothetical protein [Stenotrophomonas sp.]
SARVPGWSGVAGRRKSGAGVPGGSGACAGSGRGSEDMAGSWRDGMARGGFCIGSAIVGR